MVMPGPKLDGASIYEMLTEGRVTITAAVPTVWLMLLQHLEKNPELKLPDLDRVVIGGSACPEAVMKAFVETYGSDVVHAWGMTEMSPIGSLSTATARTAASGAGRMLDPEAEAGPPALHGGHEDHRRRGQDPAA